jgi:hypothetical protein
MGTTMTQGEAKMRILAEWRTWVGHRQLPDSNTNEDASVFFGEIEQNHPDLLSFETSEDKRELVNRWLLDAGLIRG